jgi:hypothetical protein
MDDDEGEAHGLPDLAFAALLLVLFIVAIWQAPEAPAAARRLPVLIAGIGCILVLSLGIRMLRREPRSAASEKEDSHQQVRMLRSFLLTLTYLVLLATGWLGFVTSTLCFVLALSFTLRAPRSLAGIAAVVATALGVTGAIYYGFGVLLAVPLPAGSLLP